MPATAAVVSSTVLSGPTAPDSTASMIWPVSSRLIAYSACHGRGSRAFTDSGNATDAFHTIRSRRALSSPNGRSSATHRS